MTWRDLAQVSPADWSIADTLVFSLGFFISTPLLAILIAAVVGMTIGVVKDIWDTFF